MNSAYSFGATVNIGSYQSIRIDVTCPHNSWEPEQQRQWCINAINLEVTKVKKMMIEQGYEVKFPELS